MQIRGHLAVASPPPAVGEDTIAKGAFQEGEGIPELFISLTGATTWLNPEGGVHQNCDLGNRFNLLRNIYNWPGGCIKITQFVKWTL